MANLIPMQFDKDSGRVVLSHKHQCGGGGNLPPGCLSVCGYVHEQTTAASIWLIEHNRNTSFFVTQIFNDVGEQI